MNRFDSSPDLDKKRHVVAEKAKMDASIALSLAKYHTIMPQKRADLLRVIGNEARHCISENSGDDDIEMRLNAKILFELRDLKMSYLECEELIGKCIFATITCRDNIS